MAIDKCPKCEGQSLIKTPQGRVITEKFGTLLNTSNEYSFDCLNKECKYKSEIFRVNTDVGNKNIITLV